MKFIEKFSFKNQDITDYLAYTFVFLYFIFNYFNISEIFSLSHDSIDYFMEIVNKNYSLHPHHLLFIPFMTFVSGIFMKLGIHSIVVAITVINLLAGSVSLILVYRILSRNLKFSKSTALLSIFLVSFSYGIWFYNINIETYQVPIMIILFSLLFITKPDIKYKDIIIGAIIGGISVLFHQLHGLLGLVVVIYLIVNGFKQNFKKIIVYSIIFNLIWIIGYGLVFLHLGLTTPKQISHWFFLYSYEMDAWAGFNLSSAISPFIGFLRTLVTFDGLFISGKMVVVLNKMFPDKFLLDDAYIVRNYSIIDFYLYAILLLSVAGFYLTNLIKGFKHIISTTKQNVQFRILIIFLIIYSIFFSLWDSQNLEFWMPQSIIFCIIIAVCFESIKINKRRIYLSIALVCILFTLNFRYNIRFLSDLSNDYYYEKIIDASKNLNDNSVIISDNPWIIAQYFNYYTKYNYIMLDKVNKKPDYKYMLTFKIDSLISVNKTPVVIYDIFQADTTLKSILNNYKFTTVHIEQNNYYSIMPFNK